MAIVPSGKRRKMVAQSFGNEELSSANMEDSLSGNSPSKTDNSFLTEDYLRDFAGQTESGDDPAIAEEGEGHLTDSYDERMEDAKKDTGGRAAEDVGAYIFSKLEAFGYPPRRLEEFENEFVNEKIFPEGIREVTIVIPDRYYGTRKRLSDPDFSDLVKEIQGKFGLNFTDAERKDKKISMNFTSQSIKNEDEEGEESEFAGDVLEEVYGPGNPSNKMKKSRNKTAMTIQDMMKLSKEKLIDKLINVRS